MKNSQLSCIVYCVIVIVVKLAIYQSGVIAILGNNNRKKKIWSWTIIIFHFRETSFEETELFSVCGFKIRLQIMIFFCCENLPIQISANEYFDHQTIILLPSPLNLIDL